MTAKAAMDTDSSPTAAGIHSQCRWASTMNDAASAVRSATPAAVTAASAALAAARRATLSLLSVMSA
jgi:hypothetical protein